MRGLAEMKRLLLFVAVLSAALAFSSCGNTVRRMREGIAVEGIERVEPHSLSAVDVRFRVRNRTGMNLILRQAEFEVFSGSRSLLTVTLAGRVKIPRRTTGPVDTGWRLRVSDPLAFYAAVRKVRRGELDGIRVSCRVKGRAGIFHAEKSAEMIPLSKILNIFGLSITDLNKKDL